MDKQYAHIVEMDGEKQHLETLESGLEFFNPKGGSRSKTRWGPQQVVHDSKYTEREKHQLKRYYENLADRLGKPEAIVLFGPADTKSHFKKYLDENKPQLAGRVREVRTTDSMTENQIKALVREFFDTEV